MRSPETIQEKIVKEIENATSALRVDLKSDLIGHLTSIEDVLNLFESNISSKLTDLFEELQESKAYEYKEERASDESDYKHAIGC